MKTTKLLVLFLLFLNTYQSNVFGQDSTIVYGQDSTIERRLLGNRSYDNLFIRIENGEDETILYFVNRLSYKDRISMSSNTTLTVNESNINLKIKGWGVKEIESRKLKYLSLDTRYFMVPERIYEFFLIFPAIPAIPLNSEYISIRENIGEADEFAWEGFLEDIVYDFSYTFRESPPPPPEMIDELSIKDSIWDEKPKFLGGDINSFWTWLKEHIEYPEEALKNGIQGMVNLSFNINRDGSIFNIIIMEGVDPTLDREAVRVVSSSPRWTPGYYRGKPAIGYINFAIFFQLNGSNTSTSQDTLESSNNLATTKRDAPLYGSDWEQITSVSKGSTVEILLKRKSWYKVRIRGLEGWIHEVDLILKKITLWYYNSSQ